jgi:uncharacterized protein YdaU (DUF1376 family)
VNPPKMPIHIGDYQRDTGHLRAVEHGAYLLLMFHYWSTGGLPESDDHLATIARLSRSEWKKHRATLKSFFKDGWKHGRIDYDLEKARLISEAAREAGKASGRSRSVKPPLNDRSNDRSSSVEPTLLPSNHSKKDSEAKASAPSGASNGNQIDEAEVFRFGRSLLGKGAGGQITKLRKMFHGDWRKVYGILVQAEAKDDKGEWIAGVLRGSEFAEPTAEELCPSEIYGNVL